MNYLEILDNAWQDHLKPKDPDAPTVISLFAGGGGSSLGYSMAGYRELLAVEWDDNAVATFKLNFPAVPVYHGDIAKLSVDECMKLAGLTEPGQLDLLDGSPPCQGFSTAGKRILNDLRNQLFREYVRLLRGLQPKVFVMENVSGLVKGKMKLVFAEIMRELKASGYRVKCQLMNAKYFYVPQSRERLIFVGVREDLAIEPSFLKAKTIPVTAFSAINQVTVTKDDLAEARIKSSWQMYRVLTGKERHKHFSLVKLIPDKSAPTITKDAGNTTTGLVHYAEIRKVTIPELKVLASYPESCKLVGNFKQKWERVGNSVPPLFMQAIASHIRQEILSKITLTGQESALLSE